MAALTPVPKIQFFDANGQPLVGGKLYSYAAGTVTPQVTYVDQGQTATNTNPVILDSRGEASVWLGTLPYKLKLTSATDVEIWTVDDIENDSNVTLATLAASNGSSLIGFIASGAGATARTTQSKLRDTVSVKDFGAVGDGVADDTAAIQAAIASSASGLEVFFPVGIYRVTSAITLPTGRAVRFSGTGAGSIITSTGLSSVFYRNTRGDFVEIDSLVFTGTSPAFFYDAQDVLPWTDTLYEYKITNCRFLQSAGTYHIKLDGAREGIIQNCYFQSGDGVYLYYSINCEFHACIWKDTAFGVRADTGTEGVRLVGCTMLGCGKGVYFGPNATGLALVGAIIDYCDLGVQFDSSAALVISGSYISSRTTLPALWINNSTASPRSIQVVGSVLRQNSTASDNNILRIDGAVDANIISNTLENYRNTGVEYSNCTYLTLAHNKIRKNPSYAGSFAIIAGVDSATNKIHDNIFDNTINAPLVDDKIGNTGQAIADTQFGSWVVTMTSFTVSGTPIATGRYVRNGKLVTCWATLNPNGGTIASTAGTSLLQGLPFTPTLSSTCTVSDSAVANLGVGIVTAIGLVYPPTWTASGDTKTVQFSYYIG